MIKHVYNPKGALAVRSAALGASFDVFDDVKTPFTLVGNAAVVDIVGPLVQHSHPQLDSYEDIHKRIDAAFACPEANCVVMRIDSPGGDVAGCFELSRELRAHSQSANKKLVAYTDGMAASAAYALACAASEIVVPITGFVGSIGIIEALVDQTALDAAQGLKFAFITSGERKTDGNPHVPISPEASKALQGQVDGLAELFFGLVSEMRGIPIATVRGYQAAMFFGSRAVGARLADRVSTFEELLASQTVSISANTNSITASTNTDNKAMPKFLDRDALAEMLGKALLDGDDEEKATAKKMLKALEDKEEPKADADGDDDGDKDKKEAKAIKAEGEDKEEKKEMKASDEDKEDSKAKASSELLAMAKRLHAIEAERAAEKEALVRADLLTQRPDFSAEVKATFANCSIDVLKHAVETWPKIAGAIGASAKAASVAGTRGASQVNDASLANGLRAEDVDFIDRQMGIKAVTGNVKSVDHGTALEFGPMSPAQAKARADEIAKKGIL